MSIVEPHALPDYLRRDLAYQDLDVFPVVGPNTFVSKVVEGDFWCVPIIVHAELQTSAVVGDRAVAFRIRDQESINVVIAPSVAVQPANTFNNYNWVVLAASAYGPVQAFFYLPLPSMVVPSGWTLQVIAQGLQAGDQFTNVRMVCTKIPTGPPESYDKPGSGNLRLVPTPIV